MKKHTVQVLTFLLIAVFIMSAFVGCAKNDDGNASTSGSATEAGSDGAETENELAQAKKELGDIDFGGKNFGILVYDGFKGEVEAIDGVVDSEGGSSQVINDAVYTRNTLLSEECKLDLTWVVKSADQFMSAISTESTAPTGDFYLIDYRLGETATAATAGYLHDFVNMGIDLDKSWWDSGTADFALNQKVYFMCGDVNYVDDNFTYVLIFNKKMRESYSKTVADPYQTVRDWEWTLDYFNSIIKGISNDNGDGKWDENDTYGFVTTWEYGNTFFIGSDLRYIVNNREMERPELGLEKDMTKALQVLDTAKSIYHDQNATYMSPAGQEDKGLSCFKANRAMFYSEIAQYLPVLNKEMEGDYGVLPVPKYDKAQEYYRTWTHDSGSCLSITSSVPNDSAELIGKIVQYYAILSSQEVRPAYYNIMLTSRNVRDAESGEMLDLIFQNRVFDMAFYFKSTFGFYELFKTDVYQENSNKFSSGYKSAIRGFDRKVDKLLQDLNKQS